ncbi:MAG TPA: heavy metal-binding domain-containing protein [Draconibacterium sp.]|nr:heavy metal-binding domain-containing protein [Draconibacterium sp.]
MKKLSKIFAGFVSKNEIQETHSCCSSVNHAHHQNNNGPKNTYYCPMKCEGDKTYNVVGNCPVCNMHLVPVAEKHVHQH